MGSHRSFCDARTAVYHERCERSDFKFLGFGDQCPRPSPMLGKADQGRAMELLNAIEPMVPKEGPSGDLCWQPAVDLSLHEQKAQQMMSIITGLMMFDAIYSSLVI